MSGRGAGAAEIDDRRRAAAIAVDGSGMVADEIRRLLPRARVAIGDPSTTADLIVACRRRTSPIAVAGRPAHAYRTVPTCGRRSATCVGLVGPFVLPGTTGCLRCVDARRADLDPAWPTLLDEADRATRRVVAAVDEPLATVVAALAVHEIAVWASGLGPQTLGAVVEIPYGFGPVQRLDVDLHPQCGCGWPTWQDTMGA